MNPFRKLLVQMQVITSALTAGLLVMVIVVIIIVTMMGKGVAVQVRFVAPNVPLVTSVMAGLNVVLILVAVFVPELMERLGVRRVVEQARFAAQEVPAWVDVDPAWVERSDAKVLYQLVQVLHNKTIVRAGLLEGLGMLSGMAYLVEAHEASLGFMGLSLLWLVWSIPTRTRVYRWLNRVVERLQFSPGSPPV